MASAWRRRRPVRRLLGSLQIRGERGFTLSKGGFAARSDRTQCSYARHPSKLGMARPATSSIDEQTGLLSGFTDTMRERLTPYGLFHEIISWKLPMFVPADASGPMVLAKVIERFPVQRISEWLGQLMPSRDASELVHRLAQRAEAVCRHYLSNGRRVGNYWLVGDVSNTPGRSMFVRLKGPDSGKGAPGERTDAATGEHGELLDVIRESLCLVDFKDVSEEARSFLSMPQATIEPGEHRVPAIPAAGGSPKRRGGWSPCRGRYQERLWRPICVDVE